jgi:hypothetical protein
MFLLEAKNYDLAGILDGKRPKEKGIDDAEDGGVGADTQRERQHGDGCKSGVLDQHSRGEANILPERLHYWLLTAKFC